MSTTHWRDIGAAHARHEAAKSTSQRSGVGLEITNRPVFHIPWTVFAAGAAVWLFIGFVVALAIVLT